ncbi:MAG: cob(I)yrinic acid a,c-diamide adenosyltransferase [Candidatus Omnitrophica bacterium]|nr:cob(I)yrinic acid a,c-diamide adenosyltransferase [Candidatus Omnitrophota bacterium]
MKHKNKKCGVVTKSGDRGTTSLWGGKRVSKDDPVIETLGTIDELCSYLGLIKSIQHKKNDRNLIAFIQDHLFLIGTELISGPSRRPRLKKRIDESYVCMLEDHIRRIQSKGGLVLDSFCLPGDNILSAFTDIARTVTRRAERNAVALQNKKRLKNKSIVIYLNRLSDLLYILARQYTRRLNNKKSL